MQRRKPIYSLDLETDPFKHGRFPEVFSAGIFDGKNFTHFWGTHSEVLDKVLVFLSNLPPGYIFAHNGGKFDIYYFLQHLIGNPFIIKNRIVRADFCGHEFRDSYAIMPFPLKNYKKDEIDYRKMESKVREKHKEEIIKYLKQDCVSLWELCSKFIERFGPRLTIGSTALTELRKLHSFDTLNETQDDEIRHNYYFGGRVECFEKGVIEDDLKIYDVNSMYPHAMRDYLHPLGPPTTRSKKISEKTFFIKVEGKNKGAFPQRVKNSVKFNIETGVFNVTIHEWKAAIDNHLFEPKRIVETINFDSFGSFQNFVDEFYIEREQAKISGDRITDLFTKFILNSAYGKFAQNPKNMFEFSIQKPSVILGGQWVPSWIAKDNYVIWKRYAKTGDAGNSVRVNVATAASITGASRSVLLRAIANSDRPVYCDTDAIICRSIENVPIHATNLGAWDIEKEGSKIAIAGRKMYAFFDSSGNCVKKACKGVNLEPQEILQAALGEEIIYKNDAPSFKFDGTYSFITRKVKLT